MANPGKENWNNDPELDGLLLFAQLVEEMLFDYTIDSYKAPVLNSHSLCNELQIALIEVDDGFVKKKAIEPIMDELLWNLKNDLVAKNILGNRHLTIINNLSSSSDHKILSYVETLGSLFYSKYFNEIKKQLIKSVNTPRDKSRITILSQLFVSELLAQGYSQQYIFFETKNYFFSEKQITLPSQIEQYLNIFNLKTEKWEILLKGESDFEHAKELKFDIDFEITRDIPTPRTRYIREEKFLTKCEEFPIYIIFKNINALDPFHARDEAETLLQSINNFAAYSIHKEKLHWEKSALVYSNSNHFKIVDPRVSPIYKISDSKIEELPKIIESVKNIFNELDPVSIYCIFNSFNFHSSAIQTKSSENQLMNLWTALESLLPPPKEQRILHFINSFEPFLSRRYVQKLILDLLHQLRRELDDDLDIIFLKLPSEYSDFEKCAALISIKDDNEELRDELYVMIKKNPLLRNRIYTLMRKLQSADSIYSTLELHRKRIRWHLQRIYRARNIITHKGEEIFYIYQLVEHLHFYYHIVIDLIKEIKTENENIDSLETIFRLVEIENNSHLRLLKELKDEKTNFENFRELLFGS